VEEHRDLADVEGPPQRAGLGAAAVPLLAVRPYGVAGAAARGAAPGVSSRRAGGLAVRRGESDGQADEEEERSSHGAFPGREEDDRTVLGHNHQPRPMPKDTEAGAAAAHDHGLGHTP